MAILTKGSSMLEEFQDLDNFKMIPQVNDHANTYHYQENDFDYDAALEFRGHTDIYEDQWQEQPLENHSSPTNRYNSNNYRTPFVDSEAFDPHSLPPGSHFLTK